MFFFDLLVHMKNRSGIRLWNGFKIGFFSTILAFMLANWYRKKNTVPQVSDIQNKTNKKYIKVLYGSVTGKAKKFAYEFFQDCLKNGITEISIMDLKSYDAEESLAIDVIIFSLPKLILFA